MGSCITDLEKECLKESDPKLYLTKLLQDTLNHLEEKTKGHWIVYWSSTDDLDSDINIITNKDIESFRDMFFNRTYKEKLYLDITSPGGTIEATESIMRYLVENFKEIYAIVPFMAKSSATLLCLIAKKIFMGDYSFLGAIGPLIGTHRQNAIQILKQYEEIKNLSLQQGDIRKETRVIENSNISNTSEIHPVKDEIISKKEEQQLNAFFSIILSQLYQLGSPVYEAKEAIKWVEQVAKWALENYHGITDEDRKKKIIDKLLKDPEITFHNKNISKKEAIQIGLHIEDLSNEKNKDLENDVLLIQNILRVLEMKFNVKKVIASKNQIRVSELEYANINNRLIPPVVAFSSNYQLPSTPISNRNFSYYIVKDTYIVHKMTEEQEDIFEKDPFFKLQLGSMKELWDNEEDEFWDNV